MKRVIILFFILLISFNFMYSFVQADSKEKYEKIILSKNKIPEKRVHNIIQIVQKLGKKYNVDPDLIMSIIWQETHFRNIKGDKNLDHKACGYMQIRTHTFEEIMGYEKSCQELIYSWRMAMEGGVKYFAKLKLEYGFYSAISAYNYGYPSKNNVDYVYSVLSKYRELKR